jgi:hypothetical protein
MAKLLTVRRAERYLQDRTQRRYSGQHGDSFPVPVDYVHAVSSLPRTQARPGKALPSGCLKRPQACTFAF